MATHAEQSDVNSERRSARESSRELIRAHSELEPIVYVIDDDKAVRDSLKLLIESVGYCVVAYGGALNFLEAYDEDQPGCIILDIRMPDMSGLELQASLNAMHCILPIIFITGHGDVPMAVRAIKDGAMNFIQKPFRDQEILDLVNDAIRLDLRQREELLEHKEIIRRLSTLTEREREILLQILEGKANKVIAVDIQLSQRTVEIHRSRVMEKMGTRSLAHLVRQIMQVQDHVQCNFRMK